MPDKKKIELEPPDLDRCQHMSLPGSFMTLGPRSWVRCSAKPEYIATELKPRESNGLIGSMSLCDEHKVECERRMPGEVKYDKILRR